MATAEAPSPPLRHVLAFALLAVVVSQLSLFFNPPGFAGGGSDDQRYLDFALLWYREGIAPGDTHWALRHPLILSILASFKLFGPNLDALLLVPRLWFGLLVAVTAAGLARLAGLRIAALWAGLVIVSPVMHEMATTCFPEMVELALCALSLWAFFWGLRTKRRRPIYFLIGGAAAGFACLTRETAVVVPLLYLLLFIRRTGAPRLAYLWLLAGFLPPVALDTIWLWQATGDPLYRLHVDLNHVRIASAHIAGGVYSGERGPLLNFDLASRWEPSGPFPLHWTIDPLVNLIVDPAFALIFAAWAWLGWRERGEARESKHYLRLRPALLLLAIASFVLATWVLMLRPQPRYYLLATYAATVAVALLAAPMLAARRTRFEIALALAATALVGTGWIAAQSDRMRPARLILPVAAAQREPVWLEEGVRARIAFQLEQAGLAHRVISGAPPPGGLRLRLLSPHPWLAGEPVAEAPGYAVAATRSEPRPLARRLAYRPSIAQQPALRLERRLR